MPIKWFFFTVTIPALPLLHLFPLHENLYTWEPQKSSNSYLVSYFFFAFPISGGKWNLATVTDKIDIAALKTPAFWLKVPRLPSPVSHKYCLPVLYPSAFLSSEPPPSSLLDLTGTFTLIRVTFLMEWHGVPGMKSGIGHRQACPTEIYSWVNVHQP